MRRPPASAPQWSASLCMLSTRMWARASWALMRRMRRRPPSPLPWMARSTTTTSGRGAGRADSRRRDRSPPAPARCRHPRAPPAALQHDRVIVDDEDVVMALSQSARRPSRPPRRSARDGSGMTIRTQVPRPLPVSMAKSPPRACTRSCMPRSPKPGGWPAAMPRPSSRTVSSSRASLPFSPPPCGEGSGVGVREWGAFVS